MGQNEKRFKGCEYFWERQNVTFDKIKPNKTKHNLKHYAVIPSVVNAFLLVTHKRNHTRLSVKHSMPNTGRKTSHYLPTDVSAFAQAKQWINGMTDLMVMPTFLYIS